MPTQPHLYTSSFIKPLNHYSFTMINNRAHVQESIRVNSIGVPKEPSFTHSSEVCCNVGKGIHSHPDIYKKNGFTRKQGSGLFLPLRKGGMIVSQKLRLICSQCKSAIVLSIR